MLAARYSPPSIFQSTKPGSGILELLQDPERYVHLVHLSAVSRYVVLCAVLITFWDWIVQFDDEVAYVWKRRTWLTGKPLYLLLRYGGMLFGVYDCAVRFMSCGALACEVYYYALPVGSGIFLYSTDLLLAYRALCLYRMQPKLVIFNAVFFVLSVASAIVIVILGYAGFESLPTPKHLTGCFSLHGSFIFFCCIPGLLFELWLFGMVLLRVIRYSKAGGKKPLLQLLLLDSMQWFFCIAAMMLLAALSLGIAPLGVRTIGIPPLRSAVIICGCRLVLRMMKSASDDMDATLCSQSNDGVAMTQNHLTPSAELSCQEIIRPSDDTLKPPHSRFIGIAQRIGLPPPLTSDFHDLWPADQADGESMISMKVGGGNNRKVDLDVWADDDASSPEVRSGWWDGDDHSRG